MKKIVWTAGIVVLMAAVAQATVINFTAMDPNAGSVSDGTLAFGQNLGDGEAFTSLSYTVSGLTIDADGTADDSITVTMGVTPLNGTTIDWDLIEFDLDDAVFRNAGDGISFGVIGVTGTLSSGDALVVNSAVYTEWTFRRWAGTETATIAGDETTAYVYDGAASAVALNDDTYFSVTQVGTDTWNGDNFDFTVDVIPEPAALGLIAVAGASMIFIRRLFQI